jgi:hypothetical protein
VPVTRQVVGNFVLGISRAWFDHRIQELTPHGYRWPEGRYDRLPQGTAE